jgi:hypothetical protein
LKGFFKTKNKSKAKNARGRICEYFLWFRLCGNVIDDGESVGKGKDVFVRDLKSRRGIAA